MRIVHVITKGDVGGAQTHVVELARAQIAAGDEVVIVAGCDGPAMDRARVDGARVVVVPSIGESRRRLWQRDAFRDLRSTLAELEPDVVHGHSSNAGFLARLVSRRAPWPCVYTAHGWPFQRGAAPAQRVLSFAGELLAGRLGDGVICLTEAEAERARRAHVVAPDRLWIVPNGLGDVDGSLRRQGVATPPGIVMVARFAPPKLQRELIGVMATLTDLPWSLTFVGDGPDLEGCRRHGARVLGDRVRFVGHRDDVDVVLAEHDVLVLWSRYEGMPISLLEGMRAGLCCVASDLPGVRALLGDPPVGVVAADDAALGASLRRLLVEPSTIGDLGDAARARFERCFSSTAMQAATALVYAELSTRR